MRTAIPSQFRTIVPLIGRVDLVAWAYGTWLSGMMLIQFLMAGGQASIMIGLSLGALPIGLHMFLLPALHRTGLLSLLLFLPFVAVIFISLLSNFNNISLDVVAQTMGFLALVAVGHLIAQQKDAALLEKIFVSFAVTFVLLLIVVLMDNDRLWTRLMGRLHSNLWAAITIAAIPGALALRNKTIAAATTLFLIYMLAEQFNARGPLIYAVMSGIAFCTFWVVYNPRQALTPQNQIAFIAIACLILIALIVNWDYVANQVLLINSATRGLASGFTGRTNLWGQMLGIAAERPFTGVGFRMHDLYLTTPGVFSAHSAYIAVLVDLGVIGLGAYLAVIFVALWRAIITSPNHVLAAFLVGYMLLGLTEARALNVGNPASILFIFSLVYAHAGRYRRAHRWRVSNRPRHKSGSFKADSNPAETASAQGY